MAQAHAPWSRLAKTTTFSRYVRTPSHQEARGEGMHSLIDLSLPTIAIDQAARELFAAPTRTSSAMSTR